MPICFERREKVARYLDAQTGEERRIACEVRRDPLTGQSGRVAHVLGFHLAPVDFTAMIEQSRAACPFCPERVLAVTPRFPTDVAPEGRVQRGEAVAFPNLAPYDEHSTVVVMTSQHYVPPDGFTPAILRDAFEAARGYFRQVQQLPHTDYTLIFWNYMPASGGTQIHPHLQIFATDTPGNALETELAASRRYFVAEGHSFWGDLTREEQRLGERFVAAGRHTAWLTSFVSQSLLADTLAIFPGQRAIMDVPDEALDEFCRGLAQVLGLLASEGVYSFNMAIYSGTSDRDDFWTHARISPRVYMTPRLWGTDTSALQHLYGEHYMVRTPEALAAALRDTMNL
jgi:galactose-1-phosphate uridylyltransferase